jgi:hypothetical protein
MISQFAYSTQVLDSLPRTYPLALIDIGWQ